MSQKQRELTQDEVVTLAEKYLAPHQPANYRLKVLRDGVRRDDDWWYVVVQPDRDDVYSYEYYGRLAEAELDLEEAEHLHVLLVPTLPG
jgi:hypothetical protein